MIVVCTLSVLIAAQSLSIERSADTLLHATNDEKLDIVGREEADASSRLKRCLSLCSWAFWICLMSLTSETVFWTSRLALSCRQNSCKVYRSMTCKFVQTSLLLQKAILYCDSSAERFFLQRKQSKIRTNALNSVIAAISSRDNVRLP